MESAAEFEFDEGEEFSCIKCGKKIANHNDLVLITPLDEETGEEYEDEEEAYCKDCYSISQ